MARIVCARCNEKIGGIFGATDHVYEDVDETRHFCSPSCCNDWRAAKYRAKSAELESLGKDGTDDLVLLHARKLKEYDDLLDLHMHTGSARVLKLAEQKRHEAEKLGLILGLNYEGDVQFKNPDEDWVRDADQ